MGGGLMLLAVADLMRMRAGEPAEGNGLGAGTLDAATLASQEASFFRRAASFTRSCKPTTRSMSDAIMLARLELIPDDARRSS